MVFQKKLLNYISPENNFSYIKLQIYISLKKTPIPVYIKIKFIYFTHQKYEGLPNVLLEHISLKKPIISSKCPTGPTEILDNGNVIVFKIGDHKELAKKNFICL